VEIKRLLGTTRLLTLTGSGGAGKTRLALEAAADVLDVFPDGIWVTELASVTDPALVPRVVAAAVGVRDESGRPVADVLTGYLQSKHMLLVLDNCEHLIEACAQLVDALLRACPSVRILATSRAALNIPGETVSRVPSLSLPDPTALPPVDQLLGYEAVRLFVERAAAAFSTFALTDQNAPAVVQICRRLDGMPLAIELAAARVKELTPEEIATRLGDSFRLFIKGSRIAIPRHRTLRAVIDWSYDLLSASERAVLQRLSVFAGGWTLEAAQAICAGDGVEAAEVFELVLGLVASSLVERATQGRYGLLETVRQYSWERLQETGQADEVRRRHRDWYLDLAERADPRLRGPEQITWFERLEAEHDNLRVALTYSMADAGGAEDTLRLAGALTWFWFIHGHWSEGRTWLEGALTREHAAPRAIRPTGISGAACFAWRQGDSARATQLGERGLALCRALDDKVNSVWMLMWLGIVALRQMQRARAEELIEEGVALSREIGDDWVLGLMLAQLGIQARTLREYDRAVSIHTECLSLARKTGDAFATAYQLRNLAVDSFESEQYDRAAGHYLDSLRQIRRIADRWITGECIDGLAAIASIRGHHGTAAQLFGVGETLRALTGHFRPNASRVHYDPYVAATRGALGAQEFSRLWNEGGAMPLDAGVDFALATPDVPADAAVRARAAGDASPLASREREVAILVAQGLSNRDIATRLVISERTAQKHVQHILNKLGFSSRARIATWVVQRGLLPPSESP